MTEMVVIEQCFRIRWEARFHLSMGKVFLSRGEHRDLPPRLVVRGDFARAAAAPRSGCRSATYSQHACCIDEPPAGRRALVVDVHLAVGKAPQMEPLADRSLGAGFGVGAVVTEDWRTSER